MDELLKILKEILLKKGGLKEDSNEFIALMKPENYKGYIKSLERTEIKLPTTLEEALKLPGIQSLYDKKITEAVQKRETNLKEEWDFVEKGKGPKIETEAEKRIKVLEDKQKVTMDKAVLKSKTTNAETLLKGKKIPKKLIKFFDFNSEIEISEQLESVESVYTELKQGIINENVGKKLPLGSEKDGKPSAEEAKKLVERM